MATARIITCMLGSQQNPGPSPTTAETIDWPRVWKTHGRWLRSVLGARLRSTEEVDEVFQEVALLVARKPTRWPLPEKVAPWLYRVTIQQIYLFRRKRGQAGGRRMKNDSSVVDCEGPVQTPLDVLIGLEDQDVVRMALEKLSGQDREILFLKHAENWTYQQISAHTGLSGDQVIYRIRRARTRLRKHIPIKKWMESNE